MACIKRAVPVGRPAYTLRCAVGDSYWSLFSMLSTTGLWQHSKLRGDDRNSSR